MPQSVEHHRNAVFTAHAYPFRADAYELRTILASRVSNRVPAVKTTRSASAAL
jgi:hypothetical protein